MIAFNFWEEKAHLLFTEIDELEENYNSFSETELENKQEEYSKSLKILIYRLSLEKNQLDSLERNLVKLELKNCKFRQKSCQKTKEIKKYYLVESTQRNWSYGAFPHTEEGLKKAEVYLTKMERKS